MNNPPNLKKFAGDSLYNFIRQGLALGLGLLSSIILTRGLGPDGRGIYALALLLPTLVLTFTRFGVETSTIYFMARKDFDERTIVGTNIILSLLLSIVSLSVGVCLILLAGSVLFAGVPVSYLVIALSLIPLMLLRLNLLNVLLGAQDFRTYNAAGLIPEFIRLIFTIVLVLWLRLDVVGGLIASIATELVSTIAVLAILRKRQEGYRLSLVWSGDYARSALLFGIKSYAANAISFLNYRSDKFLVNFFTGMIAVGSYDVSVALAERLWLVSHAVSSVLFPKVASMENAEAERVKLTLMVARGILWSTVIAALVVWPLADFFVVLMYGEEFRSSGWGLKLLLPGIVSLGFSRILANDIAGRGKPEINTIHAAVSFAVNITANIILIPRLGFIGASIASSISYTATALLKIVSYKKLTGASLGSMLIPTREDIGLLVKLIRMLAKRFKVNNRFA